MQPELKKHLSVFSLVMINVIAIDSLRTLPMGAEYGFSIVFFYLLTGLTFFLPIVLVSAELATGWPERGGIYIWVREAFGVKAAFFTIWLQWFYNICWYPTIMSLIAATIAYCIDPSLIDNKIYMLSIIIIMFWGVTLLNFLGMKASTVLNNISAIMGTIVPMLFIIGLGFTWVMMGKPIHTEISFHSFFPDMSSVNNLVLLTGVVYSLIGMEMSATHAREVRHPQRDYPKAALWSGLIILFTLIFGSLTIALVIPKNQVNIISGLLQAFEVFFAQFHMMWVMPILAILIVLGAIGGVNAWILSPSKGLLMASQDGCLPKSLGTTNRKGAPTVILILQGLIFTLLCSVFLLLPTVSSSYWALSDITAILSLIVYIPMFLAALRLRYKYPEVKRTFTIPLGKFGLWLTCLLGLVSCIFTIIIGFFPPSQIPVGNVMIFEVILFVGVIVSCLVPLLVYWLTNKHTRQKVLTRCEQLVGEEK